MLPRVLGRVVRAPLTQLAVLGGALFLLARTEPAGPPSHAPAAIVLDAADVERLREEWTEQYGVAPGPAEQRRLVEMALDEEVLHRAALALELDRDDPLVRERIAQIARVLDEGPLEDEEALARAARASGLDRTDLVSRRYLAQAVRLIAAGPRAAYLPGEEAVAAYFDRHRDQFAAPARQRLTHVYLSADRHGASLERDAGHLLDRLRRERVVPGAAAGLGDPFVRGADVALDSEAVLDRTFGPGFAAAVASVPAGSWEGPVRSAYGLHLVWVHERAPASEPPVSTVRNRVVLRMLREQRDVRAAAVIAGLRKQYAIRVDADVVARGEGTPERGSGDAVATR